MNGEIRQAIHLRLGQARETLEEADALHEHGLWRGLINRSYYAMFYAVLALGVFRQVALTKHTQAIAFFDKEFVKTEIFPRELSRSLHLGFDQRQVNDYGDIWTVSQEEAETIFSEARLFVESVDGYLKNQK
ncbi:MAG TPA: HEPN domain-containing protein [Anaerolineales bacterium]|nr:HEPN domain-containing protein [Anaerolineales bacterium]